MGPICYIECPVSHLCAKYVCVSFIIFSEIKNLWVEKNRRKDYLQNDSSFTTLVRVDVKWKGKIKPNNFKLIKKVWFSWVNIL